MKPIRSILKAWLIFWLLVISACSDRRAPKPLQPNLIPWPESVEMGDRCITVGPENCIIPDHPKLSPLAGVLSDEIFLATGLRLEPQNREPQRGDIVLDLATNLKGEAHDIIATDRAVVRGGNYQSAAMATVSLLQALCKKGGQVCVPALTLRDEPRSSYRGLSVDLAREWHSIDTLKQIVVLCRFYKIRYLQLHLTDDQSFTFPSSAFPKLATPGRHYSLEELKELVAFADERGVTLVPELDAPGHTTAMRDAMPELFGPRELGVINLNDERVFVALETLVDEICQVFQSSPYFHIGADESNLAMLGRHPKTTNALRRLEIDDVHDLFLHYIVKMNEYVKKGGKQTLMWESFRGNGSDKVKIPKDIIVFGWETLYELPQSLLANGYKVINATWKPLYLLERNRWSKEYIYKWNMFRWEHWWKAAPSFAPIQMQPTEQIIGASMCSWEMREQFEIPGLRHRLPALSERIWLPNPTRSYSHFHRRWKITDKLLERLIRPVLVEEEGLLHSSYEGVIKNKQNWFGDTLRVAMQPETGGVIRYTVDGSTPDAQSPLYTEALQFHDSTTLKAQLFGKDGEQIGFILWKEYELRPIVADVEGLLSHLPHEKIWEPRVKFGDYLTLTLKSLLKNSTIRYTVDGREPTADSPVYTKPLSTTQSVSFRAKCFDAQGNPRGKTWARNFRKVDYKKKSLPQN